VSTGFREGRTYYRATIADPDGNVLYLDQIAVS